jgi:hypothetical protein
VATNSGSRYGDINKNYHKEKITWIFKRDISSSLTQTINVKFIKRVHFANDQVLEVQLIVLNNTADSSRSK